MFQNDAAPILPSNHGGAANSSDEFALRLAKHNEKLRKSREWKRKNRARCLEVNEKWKQKNPDKHPEYNKKYRKLKKQGVPSEPQVTVQVLLLFAALAVERSREAQSKNRRRHYVKNREHNLSCCRDYSRSDRGRVVNRTAAQRRRARLVEATDPTACPVAIALFSEAAVRVSRCTGIKFHVDHIIPLALGGKHHHENLQLLPEKVNLSKGWSRIFTAHEYFSS